jgi:hypothetical protein
LEIAIQTYSDAAFANTTTPYTNNSSITITTTISSSNSNNIIIVIIVIIVVIVVISASSDGKPSHKLSHKRKYRQYQAASREGSGGRCIGGVHVRGGVE